MLLVVSRVHDGTCRCEAWGGGGACGYMQMLLVVSRVHDGTCRCDAWGGACGYMQK